MRAEAVGLELDEDRSLPSAHVRAGALGGFVRLDHIHAVDLERRHAESGRLHAQIGLRLGALERRAHRIEIVLAKEYHRQAPELRQVHRLVKRALGHRAFAEEAGRHPTFFF